MSDRSDSDLVQAEQAQQRGDRWQAAECYERAIQKATDRGDFRGKAIACELAATFYLKQGIETPARTYLKEACRCYEQSSESTKGRELAEEYSQLLVSEITTRENTRLHLSIAQLMRLEKMATLGQLLAGVAHEINTPLGAIQASSGNTLHALEGAFEQLPQLSERLSPEQQSQFFELLARSLHSPTQRSSREKRQIKRNLARQCQEADLDNSQHIADTLADLGGCDRIAPFLTLLKNPDSNWTLELAYNLSRLKQNTQRILTTAERVAKIVAALKIYARHDSTGNKQVTQICEGIDTALELYHNYLKKGIEVSRKYKSLPSTCCYPDELIQVWTNLIHNAIQAMGTAGMLTIAVEQQGDRVWVKITDSGSGIPSEIQAQIFEPFFTTKPVGEGSGLGLDIVKKIIDKHNGTIEVESVPGQTTFTVMLPIAKDCTPQPMSAPLNAN